MSEDLPPTKTSQPEWVNSTLTTAWIDTRMEADRTMVALSAGGIGLLVTLLTAVTVPRSWILWLYGLAFLGFLIAIGSGLAVFKRNANHLEEALADLEAAHSSRTRKKLRALDWLLMLSFAGGVVSSIAVGVATAFSSPGPEIPPPATQEFSDEGRADSTSPRNEASTRASPDPQLGGRDERADSVTGKQRSAASAPDTTERR